MIDIGERMKQMEQRLEEIAAALRAHLEDPAAHKAPEPAPEKPQE